MLFYDRQNVADFNMQKLQLPDVPIARIEAIHSNSFASSAKADDVRGLYPVIFLVVGASVTLTSNLWPEIGLHNGAVGRMYQIVYNEQQNPPNLPVAVLVDFEKYAGPPFITNHPKCIPIPPVTFEWG